MIDRESLRYACGHFCCAWEEALPPWLRIDVLLESIQETVCRLGLLCPGCQLDQTYEEARQISAVLGLQRLIGEPRSVKYAEIVRARIAAALFCESEGREWLLLFNQAFARQGRLWIHYRAAQWDAMRRLELVAALREGGSAC